MIILFEQNTLHIMVILFVIIYAIYLYCINYNIRKNSDNLIQLLFFLFFLFTLYDAGKEVNQLISK